MSEEKKVSLFREKNVESLESPEALNDYLQVTSVRVWLILATVIVLLVGAILWGIFGRIRSTAEVAVEVKEDSVLCYMPYDDAEKIMAQGWVTIDGKEYAIQKDEPTEWVILEKEDKALLTASGLQAGDLVVTVPLNCDLEPGVYSGEAITEDLQPISLLLQ